MNSIRGVVKFGEAGLNEDEYDFLLEYCKLHNIKNVLEFGPGSTTWCFIDANVSNIISLEHDQKYLDIYTKTFYEYSNVKVDCYKNPSVIHLPYYENKNYDLILVDSPKGTKLFSRLNTILWAIKNSKRVLIHDAKRSGEKSTREFIKYHFGVSCKLHETSKGFLEVSMVNLNSNLIYTTAFGRRCCCWAIIWYYSIRNFYDGDIMIYTDDKDMFKTKSKDYTPTDSKLSIIVNDNLKSKPEYIHARFQEAPKVIDVSKYEYILFTDVDVVARAPINKIFQFAKSNIKDGIGYITERIPANQKYFNRVAKLLNKEEIYYDNSGNMRWGINSGFYVCNSGIFKDYMKQWDDLYKKHLSMRPDIFSKTNQSQFNWLIRTNEWNAIECPDFFMTFPEYNKRKALDYYERSISDNVIFHHFTGINDSKVQSAMRDEANKYLSGDVKIEGLAV